MDHSTAIHNLASGSSANALLVRHGAVSVLIDCGLPPRRLSAALAGFGLRIDQIDLVFVTHEHSDHIRALPRLMKAGATVLTSKGTASALGLARRDFVCVSAGRMQSIAGIDIAPLAVDHDSAEPLAVQLGLGPITLTVMTDLGRVAPQLQETLAVADVIVIEANHDLDMLRLGPYPAHLKRRVMSDRGHLSNADCGQALRSALLRRGDSPEIWLAHLSETNNRPVTAATTVRQYVPGVRVASLPRHEVVDLLAPPASAANHLRRPRQQSLWEDRAHID
jgi:phosphoribosyl 1,2-cyclic phosphodiesterase